MLFFTGDTHFGDPRVLRIDRRPFPNMKAHDEGLIALWNETVTDNDEVWHLGDFALVRVHAPDDLLARLNGTKHLVIGNNDSPETIEARGWASVQHYTEIKPARRHLILCHYPFRTWNQMGRKSIDLHGHSHGKLKPLTRQYDVGVDAQEFRPATLETIMARRPARGA